MSGEHGFTTCPPVNYWRRRLEPAARRPTHQFGAADIALLEIIEDKMSLRCRKSSS